MNSGTLVRVYFGELLIFLMVKYDLDYILVARELQLRNLFLFSRLKSLRSLANILDQKKENNQVQKIKSNIVIVRLHLCF